MDLSRVLNYVAGRVLFASALANAGDVEGWRLEGEAAITFPRGRMRMENLRDPQEGQVANFVFWCPQDFPDNIEISWRFQPMYEPGLCILFFAAGGRNGEDLFDATLNSRSGPYEQYHHGDINALHISYFRRRSVSETRLHTCNLRKSYGFHLVAQGADPIPSVAHVAQPYQMRLAKMGRFVSFSIDGLPIVQWEDCQEHGPILRGGKIGFRQMAPLIAEYSDFTVRALQPVQ